MEQKRQNKQKRRAAFTLAEFLTVIAIVGILASLSFVAVIHYQRKLRRLEMDQTAKEIFLAAQNHLTLEVSNGTIPRLLHMEAQGEFSDDQKQAKLGISVENTVLAEEKEGNIYAVLYVPEKQAGQPESEQEESGGEAALVSANVNEEIRQRLLPFGSIDETVRGDGSYLIFYDPEAGLVREVWYSDHYQFVQTDSEARHFWRRRLMPENGSGLRVLTPIIRIRNCRSDITHQEIWKSRNCRWRNSRRRQ